MKHNLLFPIVCVLLGHFVHAAEATHEAQAILDLHGNRGGFAVYLGEDNGETVLQLGKCSNYSVHGLLRNSEAVERTRGRLKQAKQYGRCSVEPWGGGELPYIANLVSLLVCENPESVSEDEVLRVLAHDGLALFRDGNGWKTLRKPIDPKADQWPQEFYDAGNNAVSNDMLVAPPRHLQWRGSPRWGRFHERMSSFAAMVSAGGRVFYIMDHGSPSSIFFPSKWKLVARDAYNGVVLWDKPIDEWVTRFYRYKAGPSTVPRRLVATDEFAYVTLGIKAPLTKLCARSGRVLETYPDTEFTDEIVMSGDMLLIVLRPELSVPTNQDDFRLNDRLAFGWEDAQPAKLVALNPATGSRLWEWDSPIAPLSLAADSDSVYLCDWKRVQCLDRTTGEQKWASDELKLPTSYPSGNAPRLTVNNGVVLLATSENVNKRKKWDAPPDPLSAFDAVTGRRLWTAEHTASGFHSPEDLFVIGNTVWFGATMDGDGTGEFTGLDLKTGAVTNSFTPDDTSYWFHQRCYPQKATQRYILTSRTGIEYVDPLTGHWELNHWVRGACTFGVMPANGLTYAPPHPCACYPESKLSGMNALSATQQYSLKPMEGEVRLLQGPAYKTPWSDRSAASTEDWPCLRGNAARTSYSRSTLAGVPDVAWSTEVEEKLTSPTVGGGLLFVAAREACTVYALDAECGERKWSFTASGRIDSSPTYAYGHVVFGSRDGYVYCLRAADGVLRWRFLAAKHDKRLFNFEQLESVWPVFGSVLVVGDEAFVTAGRSIFLDGGITFYRLDLATGRVLNEQQLTGHDPQGKDYHKWVADLSMPAGNNDVLSSKGNRIYMGSQVMTKDGTRIMRDPGAVNEADHDSHIFSPTGYLDDSWWHRGYFAYGNGVSGGAGWPGTLNRIISGKLLCADEEHVYGFAREPKYRKWTVPLEFELTATTRSKLASQDQNRRAAESRVQVAWTIRIPMLVKGMFVTDNALVVAGPRDLYDEEQAISARWPENDEIFALQQEHMEGKHGSLLEVFDKLTGERLHTMELDETPTWDGMITAGGRIYITTTGGGVLCLGMH